MKKTVLSIFVVSALVFTSCKKATEGAKNLKDATVETAGEAADATKDAANAVVDGAKDATKTVVDATKDGANAVVDGAKDAANSAVDATKDAANAAVNNVKDAANTAVDSAKDAANTAVEGAKDMVSSKLEGVTIPTFSNPAVTENLKEYAAYAKDYIAAKGNTLKISQLAPKGAELLAKGKELSSSLNAAELTKYNSVIATIKSKLTAAGK
ncbi:hypothetical protein [uncultured Polaribacter sp.]|uniref:hypothetical protein n=1 Tax=uncultured Polaribacter sp. TaxID=174711 RepID=UPI002602621B|nr:hypothetical protein [uncultured Polaribacter sp.]